MKNKPIYVTQPSLASLEEYVEILKGVWETNLKVRPEKDWENLLGRSII